MSKHKRIYLENHGCAANKFDIEIMRAHLINTGYLLTRDHDSADLLLLNTCGVKKPTEDRLVARLHLFSQLNKPLIITGCLPKINLPAVLKAAPNFSAILGPQSVNKIIFAVQSAMNGKKKIYFSEKPLSKLEQPKARINKYIEIIAISVGCMGACTYCSVKFARGDLYSYPKELIVQRIRKVVNEGVNEIWLTSQDSGAYGLDLNTSLVELLKE